MPKLKVSQRAALPDRAFAYVDSRGQRRVPINDVRHVRNALPRFRQVVRAVHRNAIGTAAGHEVDARADEFFAVGVDVHVASRVSAAAHGGQILLSSDARTAVDDNTVAFRTWACIACEGCVTRTASSSWRESRPRRSRLRAPPPWLDSG